MSEGHADAWHYPLGFLWTEARIARERINKTLATETVLMQAAIVSVWSGDKKGHFKKIIRSLENGG